jgi:hypothetical protein
MGVTGSEVAATLHRHIAACSGCAADLAQFEAAARRLLLLPGELDPPVGFDVRVMDRIKRDSSIRGGHLD